MADPQQLPGRECQCQGDGVTLADTSACPVHTDETSPLAQGVEKEWEQNLAYGRGWADGRAHALRELTSEATIKAAVARVPAYPIDPPHTVRLIAAALVAVLTTTQGGDDEC